jgi:hypothetical protein
VIRKGLRKNKYGEVQLYYCHHCRKKFTPLVSKHKSFPLRVILDAITAYNRLDSLEGAATGVGRKYGIAVSRQSLTNWLEDFRPYLPVARLRPAIARTCDPRRAFLECQFIHGQVYGFKYHRPKTQVIIDDPGGEHARFRPLAQFLESVPESTPHHLFRDQRSRASTHKAEFDLSGVRIVPKDSAAIAGARIALQAVSNNKLRHEVLQEFMLVNDSVTVAVEVPVYLTPADIQEFRDRLGYAVPFTLARGECLTGHIDIVQIRNGVNRRPEVDPFRH